MGYSPWGGKESDTTGRLALAAVWGQRLLFSTPRPLEVRSRGGCRAGGLLAATPSVYLDSR